MVNIPLLFKKNGFMTSYSIDNISGLTNSQVYTTIEEVLFAIDDTGVFRNDLRWKMVMTILRSKQ